MCAKIDRSRKHRTRNPPPMILPDDLYDYLDDRPQRPAASRSDAADGPDGLSVIDDWPDIVPVMQAEIDIFERYFGDVLDRLFGASRS